MKVNYVFTIVSFSSASLSYHPLMIALPCPLSIHKTRDNRRACLGSSLMLLWFITAIPIDSYADPSPESLPLDLPATNSVQQQNAETPPGLKTQPKKGTVDRFIIPLTDWVEEKVQRTTLLNSAVEARKTSQKNTKGLSLREAIKRASNQYEGTVLSAERIDQEGVLSYQVSILSKQGVVKTILIGSIIEAAPLSDRTTNGNREAPMR